MTISSPVQKPSANSFLPFMQAAAHGELSVHRGEAVDILDNNSSGVGGR